MKNNIPKNETELLSSAITRIVSQEVLKNDISGKLPTITDLRDSNTVYRGKVSVLFVDMRNSTKLPEAFSPEQLVKIYRSYIRTIVQAVRYSGGFVRDFMGDGVLAVFVDNENSSSEDNVVYAAKYIVTTIDKFLNPVLHKHFNHNISYGVGVHTGEISLSKVGMKGKEQDEGSESEFGIAWIGNSTNLACKQSSAVDRGTIFISPSTYANISDLNEKKCWKRVEIKKGDNTLIGYIAKHHYLTLDEEIAPCVTDDLFDDGDIAPCFTSDREAASIIKTIERKTEALADMAQSLGKNQKELSGKEMVLKKKEELLNTKEKALNSSRYHFYCDVLRSGFYESKHAIIMGQDFWEENLNNAIFAGKDLGKSEHEVKQDVSYIMVSIYVALELYDYAYDFLVEQALGNSWLHLHTVQEIVKKVRYCERLKSAVASRLDKCDLLPDDRKEFEKIDVWLNSNLD